MSEPIERHARSVRLAHWTSAALVLSLLGLGLAMVDSLAPWRTAGVALHKAGGLAVLLLTALRFVLRRRHPPPAPPASFGRLQRLVAGGTHAALYALLVCVPLSGWAMQGAAGTPVRLFGRVPLPAIAPESLVAYGILREAHGLLTTALLLAVLLHIAGALHDGFVARTGVLRRMLG